MKVPFRLVVGAAFGGILAGQVVRGWWYGAAVSAGFLALWAAMYRAAKRTAR